MNQLSESTFRLQLPGPAETGVAPLWPRLVSKAISDMNTPDWLKTFSEIVGALILLLGLLFAIALLFGIEEPIKYFLMAFGYILLFVFLLSIIGAGIVIGSLLWESKIKWKMAIGVVLFAASAILAIAIFGYIYDRNDTSDCPSGVPLRYC